MTCGEYEIRRGDRVVGLVVFDDEFARGFGSLRRVRDAPCAGEAPAPPSMLRRAASWLRAEASLLIEGRVALPVYEARLTQCRQCPRLVPNPADEVGFCGACGCGRGARARLAAAKAWMPKAKCPLKQW